MTTLAQAVEQERWELVALRLLLAVAEALAELPPEALVELLEMLGGLPEEGAGGRDA